MVEKTHYLEWQAMQGCRGWGDEPLLCPSDSWRSEFSKGKEHLVSAYCMSGDFQSYLIESSAMALTPFYSWGD